MRLKFITLNVWHGGRLFDNIVDFLKKENADILALQEAQEAKRRGVERRFKTTSSLMDVLDYPYFSFEPELSTIANDADNSKILHGNLVLSKFPIISAEATFFDLPFGPVVWDTARNKGDFEKFPKNIQHTKIKASGGVVNVFNVHGIWGKHGDDTERRIKMGKIIADKVKSKKKVILAGDFNLNPSTKTIVQIEKHLTRVFNLRSTFNLKHKPSEGFSQAAVDMIFVSPDIKVTNRYCPPVNVSDHLPLVVELEI